MKVLNWTYASKDKVMFVLIESKIAIFYMSNKKFQSAYASKYNTYYEFIDELFEKAQKRKKVLYFHCDGNFRVDVSVIQKIKNYRKVFPFNCYLKRATRYAKSRFN